MRWAAPGYIPAMQTPRERPTVRVLLFDPDHRLLLMKGRLTYAADAPSWWFTVGGGMEPGETPEAAACREVAEETGFLDIRLGPVVWRREGIGHLSSGEQVLFKEHYLVAHCAGGEPLRDGWEAHEVDLVDDLRWWHLTEIRSSDERIFPQGLADLLPVIIDGQYPDQPLTLAWT